MNARKAKVESDQRLSQIREVLESLAACECVVPDGDWVERFADRLSHTETAAAAAREAMNDGETIIASAVLGAFWAFKVFPREAVAAALRDMCLDAGVNTDDPADLRSVFCEARKAECVLMTQEELRVLKDLPVMVDVYRGQLYQDGYERSMGPSWTLSEEVAGWYAAPVSRLNQPHGWVLHARIPRDAVLAVFLERGEQEVVVDLTYNLSITARRGLCDVFPEHLAKTRAFLGL